MTAYLAAGWDTSALDIDNFIHARIFIQMQTTHYVPVFSALISTCVVNFTNFLFCHLNF